MESPAVNVCNVLLCDDRCSPTLHPPSHGHSFVCTSNADLIWRGDYATSCYPTYDTCYWPRMIAVTRHLRHRASTKSCPGSKSIMATL